MEILEIRLRQLPTDYTIQLHGIKDYDIVLDNGERVIYLEVDNLSGTQALYDGELYPIFFRLIQDNPHLTELKSLPGVINTLRLKEDSPQTYARKRLTPENANLHLGLEAVVTQYVYITPEDITMRLTDDANVAYYVPAVPEPSTMRLYDYLSGRLLTALPLLLLGYGLNQLDGYLYEYDDMLLYEMENYVRGMRLVQSNIDLAQSATLGEQDFEMSLQHGVDDLWSEINMTESDWRLRLYEPITSLSNISYLDVEGREEWVYDLLYQYDDFMIRDMDDIDYNPVNLRLRADDVQVIIYTVAQPDGVDLVLTNTITKDIIVTPT